MDYLHTAHRIYKLLEADSLFFTYQGNFSDSITSSIISLIEENFNNRQDIIRMRNKVSFLMVESFQNVIRHSEHSSGSAVKHSESFQVRNLGNTFYITSTNLVHNDRIDFLRQNLDKLNTLDKQELKTLYMKSLDHNMLSDKGGAGLGLIEMARKSGQKLRYDFIESEIPDWSYFYLQTAMRSTDSEQPESKLADVAEFHKLFQQQGIFVVNKGNFSQGALMPMFEMVEQNLASQVRIKGKQKMLYHLLVEMLQNIGNHAFTQEGRNEGVFFMGYKDANFFITAGNYIATQQCQTLSNNIDYVNSLDKEELNKLYRDKLRSGSYTKSKGAGLGLIDLARTSKSKLGYRIYTEDSRKSFFAITVTE